MKEKYELYYGDEDDIDTVAKILRYDGNIIVFIQRNEKIKHLFMVLKFLALLLLLVILEVFFLFINMLKNILIKILKTIK